jgi:hypothetical protein
MVAQAREGEQAMTIEKRKGSKSRYYYRAERRGGKVVRTYVGRLSDPVVTVIHRTDRSQQALQKLNTKAERADDSAEHDRLTRAYDVRFGTILNLIKRETVMTTTLRSPPSGTPDGTASSALPGHEDFLALVARAEDGSQEAEDELHCLLDRHNVLWERLGDVGRLLETHLINVASRGSKLLRWSIQKSVEEKLRSPLLVEGASPLEVLLVDRVIACQLDVTIRQARADAVVNETSMRRRQRLLDQAVLRQFASVNALAEFRRTRTEPIK